MQAERAEVGLVASSGLGIGWQRGVGTAGLTVDKG
jgi:hypothetical protein